MSYAGFTPSEYALWLSQQVQQRNMERNQALLNYLSIPQHPLPTSSQPASYPATPQVQIPTGSFSTIPNSTYPTAPYTLPYQMASFPMQFPQVPFPHAGNPTPAYGSLENTWRSTPQYYGAVQSGARQDQNPVSNQQVLPIRALQQNQAPSPYGNQSTATHLTTIHPSLGLCVLVPVDQMRASAPPSFGNWEFTNGVGHRPRDNYSSRVDRFRRRHSRELTPYLRSMTPSPMRSPVLSPYLPSPSSSGSMTPVLHHRRHNTPEFGRSPRRFRGIGGFTPLRSQSALPRPNTGVSISTVGTCSQCGGTGADSSYEPFTDGSVAPTPRVVRDDVVVGQGESSRMNGETQGGPVEDRRYFQASVEEDVE